MPRSGVNGTFTLPGAQNTQQPNTTIPSAVNNQGWSDVEQTFNTPQPLAYGGTGATTAVGGADALSTKGTDIASAGTTNLAAATGVFVHITGTTTITAFGTATAGVQRNIVFDGALTLTHNATSLILPGGANIQTAPGDTAMAISEGSGNWRVVDYQRASGQAVVSPNPAPRGQIFGLTLSNNVTDATNDIDIAAGDAASDAVSPTLITLSTGITKRLDAAWAVGTGNGGLDTGSIANTTYHVWLIQRSDTGVVDALFSASATAPTMPANYDRKRRIGAILRESVSIVPFIQDGDYFRRKSASLDVNIASTAVTTAVTTTLSVPIGISVQATFNYQAYDATNANQVYAYFSDLAVNDENPTNSGPLTSSISLASSAVGGAGTQTIRTNTSAQIRRRQSGAGTTTIRVATLGWLDARGRSA